MKGPSHWLTPFVHGWTRIGRWMLGGQYGRIPPPDAWPEERVEDLGFTRLGLLRWAGPGPVVLLLHGLNQNAWGWARTAPLLSPEREVLSVSLRGHGFSFAPDTGYGLEETSSDILALLDHLGLDRVDLGGHSWGGKVALHLAIRAPERVRSLLLADPVPPAGFNWVLRTCPALVEAALRPERGPFRNREDFEVGGRLLPYAFEWDAVQHRLWFDSFREQPDGSWRHTLPETGYREILDRVFPMDLTPYLGRVACPVLWMLPTFCVAFWPGELRSAWRSLPQVRVVRVPGDHAFIWTNPLDTARAIRDFLAGVA